MRGVAAVFLAVLGACGPLVESAEATSLSAPAVLATGAGCEAVQAKCVGGCKAEHKRCQTQGTILCAPQAAIVVACLAQACPPRELLVCTQGCAEEYGACTARP
jgi:hypothetical protein